MQRWGGPRTDEVAILEVKAVQLVTRLFRIHHVFIDNESCALGAAGNSLADLATLLACCGSHPLVNIPDWTKLAEEVEELLGSDVVAVTR